MIHQKSNFKIWNYSIAGDNHSVSLANTIVHYMLQSIAKLLSEVELFRKFINEVFWATATETCNGRIRQVP